jgi:ubiquinone/menaquinone biosynthesis C-methylase UbiE
MKGVRYSPSGTQRTTSHQPATRVADPSAMRHATLAHYEAFPFIEGGSRRVELWRVRLQRDLPDKLIEGRLVLDGGSGVGEVAHSLSIRGARMVCVDLTHIALRRNHELHPEVGLCQADALALPFADETFDHSISIGVLHHTPDCHDGLAELARVTRHGGRLIVLLYSRWTPYHAVYRATARLRLKVPVTRLDRASGWPMRLLANIAHVLIHQRLDEPQLRRLIADQFWTPQASFHSAREVRKWAVAIGLDVRQVRRIPLYSNVFVLQRH